VLWSGAVLELVTSRYSPRLGPDILGEPPDYETMLRRLRAVPQERELGDALLDQRLVAGIGNLWKAEALWEARVSPWRRLDETGDDELLAALAAAHELMRASVTGARPPRHVYRRKGRACPRCGGVIRSAPQGDNARTAYWCPGCQVGGSSPPS
jgi:endonuclease-8